MGMWYKNNEYGTQYEFFMTGACFRELEFKIRVGSTSGVAAR